MDSLSPSPTITIPIVRRSKTCLVLVKMQYRPSNLWHRNTAGHIDSMATTNSGYTKRKARAVQSREIDIMGRLHLDLSFQNRYFLNGIEIFLRLNRSKEYVCFHGDATLADYTVSLKEVTLFVRKVKPNSSIELAHAKALQQATAKCPPKTC